MPSKSPTKKSGKAAGSSAPRTPTKGAGKKRGGGPLSPRHATPPRTPPPAPPPPPPVASRCARTPHGVSGWMDLSARHRMLLGWGPRVYQRRFFEIDWTRRRISYFNYCIADGDCTVGDGPKKEIAMDSIIRLVSPSQHARPLVSGVRNAPFDIVTPDRVYTLMPLITTAAPARLPGGGDGGGVMDAAADKAAQMSPGRSPGGGGYRGNEAAGAGGEVGAGAGAARRRSSGGGQSSGGGGSWSSWTMTPFGPFACGCGPSPGSPGHDGSGARRSDLADWERRATNAVIRQHQQHQQLMSPAPPPPLSPPPLASSSSSSAAVAVSPRAGALQSEPYDGPPTLSVRDFQVPIVDSNFSPAQAGSTLKRLLRRREVTETGIPWEFECPLTLEIMEDPVLAADGATYERTAIEEWYKKSNGAPVMGYSDGGGDSGYSNATAQLRPNYRLREEIAAYKKAKAVLQEQQARSQKKQSKTKAQQPRSPRSSLRTGRTTSRGGKC